MNSDKFDLRTAIEYLGDWMIPKRYRQGIIKYLERASIRTVPYYQYGVTACVLLFVAIISYFFLLGTPLFVNFDFIVSTLAAFVVIPAIFLAETFVVIIIYKVFLDAKIYFKVRSMEDVFPEFLSELALNLKSGQSLEEALENSTEKEFGYLSEEIGRLSNKVRLGSDVETALREFIDDYDSEVMDETFELIITSWKKGASTSQMVERIYENLMVLRYLRKKVIASVTSYRIFLSIVTIVIAPAMFALSAHMIDLISKITGRISLMSTGVAMPITINAVRIVPEEFKLFSILALILMAASTAVIISVIKTGTVKEGYRSMIIFSILTYLAFEVAFFVFRFFFAMFNV